MPNVPDELAEEWLAPYVQELGPRLRAKLIAAATSAAIPPQM
jgi:hypothetical protein